MANTPISTTLSTATLVSDGPLYANGVVEGELIVTVRDTGGLVVGVGSAGQDATAEVTLVTQTGPRNVYTPLTDSQTNTLGQVSTGISSFRSGQKTVVVDVLHDDDQISNAERPSATGVGQVGLRDAAALSAPKPASPTTLTLPVGLTGGTGWAVTAPDTLTFADGGILDLYGEGGEIETALFTETSNNRNAAEETGSLRIASVDSDTQLTVVEQTLVTEAADTNATVVPKAWVGMDYTAKVTIGEAGVVLENCRITGRQNDGDAVVLSNGYAGATLRNCEITSPDLAANALVWGREFRLEKCYLHAGRLHGVHVLGEASTDMSAFIQQCYITNISNFPGAGGSGVYAPDCSTITVRGTYISIPSTAGACIEAVGVTRAVSGLVIESDWLDGGDTTVKITDGGGGVPTSSPVQNIRFGANYGTQLMLHDGVDGVGGSAFSGSTNQWNIWDADIQAIGENESPGTWVNRHGVLGGKRFGYLFPVYRLSVETEASFQLPPLRFRGAVSVGTTEAGGVS